MRLNTNDLLNQTVDWPLDMAGSGWLPLFCARETFRRMRGTAR